MFWEVCETEQIGIFFFFFFELNIWNIVFQMKETNYNKYDNY